MGDMKRTLNYELTEVTGPRRRHLNFGASLISRALEPPPTMSIMSRGNRRFIVSLEPRRTPPMMSLGVMVDYISLFQTAKTLRMKVSGLR